MFQGKDADATKEDDDEALAESDRLDKLVGAIFSAHGCGSGE